MIDPEQALDRTAVDRDGRPIGTVAEIYVDEHAAEKGEAGWAAVRTGLFGHHVAPVPLAGATLAGDTVAVRFPKEMVERAPHHDPEMALSHEEEAVLFEHYGLPYSARMAAAVTGTPEEASAPGREPAPGEEAALHVGAGQGSLTRLRRLPRGGQPAASAEAGIDVTGPPVYADDAVAAVLERDQARREEEERERRSRGL